MFCFWWCLGPGKRPNAIPSGCNSIISSTHTSIILSRNQWGITARHISCCASIAGINQSEICQLRSSTLRLATLSMQRLSHHWMQHFQLSSKHTHMVQTSIKYTPASAWSPSHTLSPRICPFSQALATTPANKIQPPFEKTKMAQRLRTYVCMYVRTHVRD